MNKDTEAFIADYKQKKELEDLYNQNTIPFDFYFKYSGKIEHNNRYQQKFEREIEKLKQQTVIHLGLARPLLIQALTYPI